MNDEPGHDEIGDLFPSPFVGLSVTLEEFRRRGYHFLKPYLELIDGVVCQRDAFSLQQSGVLGHLISTLDGVGWKRRYGIALPSLDCVNGELLLVTAGSYYRKSTLKARSITSFEDEWGPPDIAIEMVPSETCGYTMVEKCQHDLRVGIPVVMLVDADEESIQIMSSDQAVVNVRGDQRIDLHDVIPELDLTAAALFRDAFPDWMRRRAVQAEDAAAPECSGD